MVQQIYLVITLELLLQIFSEKTEVIEDEEVGAGVAFHGGVCLGVAAVVAAVWDLLSAPSPPLLLCLGTATRDKEVVVSLAASYLGKPLQGILERERERTGIFHEQLETSVMIIHCMASGE